MLRDEVEHNGAHLHELHSQNGNSASFIGRANTDSVQVDNFWLDDTCGDVEDSRDVEQEYLVSESRSQSCRVLKRAPLGSYITVTSSEGDRVYLRMKSKVSESNQLGFSYTKSGLQLLKVPFSELKESVEEEVHRHANSLYTALMLTERIIQLPQENSIPGIVCILLEWKPLPVIISYESN